MKSIKVISAIILLLTNFSSLKAQQQTIEDIFPLTIGNKWKFSFVQGSSSSFVHQLSENKGTVEYEIIGRENTTEGIRWKVFQRRDFTKSFFISYEWHYEYIKDSSNFEIIEIENGLHELYTPSYEQYGVFGLRYSEEDSSKFFRYVTLDYPDSIKRTINFPDQYNPPPMYNHKYSYSLLGDTGIVKMTYRKFSGSSNGWADYIMQEFHGVYNDPHLSIPQKGFSLMTMTGTAKDTTIKIANDGLQSLLIANIVSDNENFSISDFSNEIAPRSEGFITIRYNSSITGTSSGMLFINSNSVSTPDTIYLTCTFYEEAIMALQTNESFDFGFVINGSDKKISYTIENKGNIPLRIDSVKIDNPFFTNTFYTNNILPGVTVTDTICFTPSTTSLQQGTLMLYSNDKTSPEVLHLSGKSAPETIISMSRRVVDFGTTGIGVPIEEIVTITNFGTESIYLYRHMKSGNCCSIYWPFSFKDSEWNEAKEIKPGESFNETLLFTPLNYDKYQDAVVYEFFVPGIGITRTEEVELEGNIPYSLEQNYPNPFNSLTKIRFHVGTNADVTLKVFDSIGREVAVPVHENMKPGYYERVFNGSGLASGVYFYRLQTKDFNQTRKFLLLK